MVNKDILKANIERLRSTIIGLEFDAERRNQELQVLHRRLEETQVELSMAEAEEAGC